MEWCGHPVILCFCGGSWCADVAKEWTTLQRGDPQFATQEPPDTKLQRLVTAIFYQGNAEEVRNLATSSGLDLS